MNNLGEWFGILLIGMLFMLQVMVEVIVWAI